MAQDGVRTVDAPPGSNPVEFLTHSLVGQKMVNTRTSKEAVAAVIRALVGYLSFSTRADLYAAPAMPVNTEARVFGDTDVNLRGVYKNTTGGAGSGAWTRVGPLPDAGSPPLLATLADVLAGTDVARVPSANTAQGLRIIPLASVAGTGAAYTATLPPGITLEAGMFFLFQPHVSNTVAGPTLNADGTARALRDIAGNPVPAGRLRTGQIYVGYRTGTTFRLLLENKAVDTLNNEFEFRAIRRYVQDMSHAPTMGSETGLTISSGDPSAYVVNEYMDKVIRWTKNDPNSELDFTRLNNEMRADVVYEGGSNPLRLYCGNGAQWSGLPAGEKIILLPRDSSCSVLAIQSLRFITVHSASAPVDSIVGEALPRTKTLSFAGQSHAVRTAEHGVGGFQLWVRRFTSDTWWFHNGAIGATYLMQANAGDPDDVEGEEAAPGSYWWRTDNTPGPVALAWDATMGDIPTGQPVPSIILWDQQEADHYGISVGKTTQAQHQAAAAALFAWMRGRIVARGGPANCPIILNMAGAANKANADLPVRGRASVRISYHNLIAADANLFQGAEKYDLPYWLGEGHLVFKAYWMLGQRTARVVGRHIYGDATGASDLGPGYVSSNIVSGSSGKTARLVTNQMESRPDATFMGPHVAIYAAGSSPDVDSPIPNLRYRYDSSTDLIIDADQDLTGARIFYPWGNLDTGLKGQHVRDNDNYLPLRGFYSPPLS